MSRVKILTRRWRFHLNISCWPYWWLLRIFGGFVTNVSSCCVHVRMCRRKKTAEGQARAVRGALRIFDGTGVQITGNGADLDHKAGHRHLGAAVGSASFAEAYLDAKVASWVAQVERLSDVAATQPHAAYAAFVFGLRHRWTFVQRTMPTAQEHMEPLQAAIRQRLVPALIHHQPSDLEMELLTLPASLGGMSFDDPIAESPRKNADSIKCTARLTRLICDGEQHLPPSAIPGSTEKAEIRKRHQEQAFAAAEAIQERLPQPQRRAMEVARLKGASSILTTLPIAEHGFYFECKSDFFDMVHLWYCWPITNLPSTCSCGAQHSLNHSQICNWQDSSTCATMMPLTFWRSV